LHAQVTRPGLVVMDAALKLLATNPEAVQILTYPGRPEKIRHLSNLLNQKIKSEIIDHRAPEILGAAIEFRSGRRTYVCRSFSLNPERSATAVPSMLLVMERRPQGQIPMSEVFDRFGLTRREQETIKLLLQGLTSKEIATRMSISPNTVKAFLRLVMVKMGVSTRSGIIGKIVGSKSV
jgi:DNA-binding CsgD family transcriptional regulator